MTQLTIFTSPKPFTKNPHIDIIQRNAFESWTKLGDDVDVVIIVDEEGMQEVAATSGVKHIKEVRCNAHGTPLIPSLFDIAREVTDSPILAFANADVIVTRAMVDSALQVFAEETEFLMVGQRYDIQIVSRVVFDGGWEQRLLEMNQAIGHLHGTAGSDYFIFPRE